MQKILYVEPEKCSGCRTCETVCSLNHEKVYNPARARIHVVKWENAGLYIPVVCQHCETAVCEIVCPMQAIQPDKTTGALRIDYDLCVNCKLCLKTCPFAGIRISKGGKVVKCDMCGGDPVCVKNCEPGALQYLDATTINLRKSRAAAEKFSETMKKLLGAI
ncbi:MAG: 4Fe-4S dicluster domain-containing protein [Promethearchaeota archaeon]